MVCIDEGHTMALFELDFINNYESHRQALTDVYENNYDQRSCFGNFTYVVDDLLNS